MGSKTFRTDFEWIFTDEPHASRRKKILEKYPEIKQLYGSDPKFKWVVTALVAVQLLSLPFVQHLSWPTLLPLAYCFGGVISHALMLAIHEIGHNLAFGHARPMANRLLGFFANLPLAIPASVSFKKYHKEHHKHQAIDTLDPDLPTAFEGRLCSTTLGKLFWLALFPVFYLLRPYCVRPLPLEPLEVVNGIVQLVFDACVVHLFGWKTLLYCFVSLLITMTGFHPLAGHFISEHYMLKEGVETCSYYGPLNALAFNFGYHMEHHDFPAVPASRLPEVKRIAAEFYEELPHHTSLCSVIYQFVMDPSIGPYARIKRKQRAGS